MSGEVTLVLGGARAGKSALAERLVLSLAEANRGAAIYIATGQGGDAEMNVRIAAHKARRGDRWTTIEEPLDLLGALATAGPGDAVLVDCLTLWLANLMAEGRDPDVDGRQLAEALQSVPLPVALVSNEVGLGIVPDNALARAFRDHAGRLHQRVAAVAGRVLFVAAGLPLALKGSLPDLPYPILE